MDDIFTLEHEKDILAAQLTSARSRIEELEGALRWISRHEIIESPTYSSGIAQNIVQIARQALSGKSEPVEPKEVSVEELSFHIHDTWSNEYVAPQLCDDIAEYIISKYTIKEKG